MMDNALLDFVLNEHYLMAHAIEGGHFPYFSTEEGIEEIKEFREKAREISPLIYKRLTGVLPESFAYPVTDRVLHRGKEILIDYLDRLKQTAEFERVLETAESYRQSLKQGWEHCYPASSLQMEDITRLDFTDDEYTVYITHPTLTNSGCDGSGRVFWGMTESQEGIGSCGLWSAVLHMRVPWGHVSRAVTELAADNELRVRLYGGDYFELGLSDYLDSMEHLILDDWFGYLRGDTDADILGFIQRMEEQLDMGPAE